MKLRIVLGLVLGALIVSPAFAQVGYEGNIYLTVNDEDGAPVEGAEVKVIGSDYTRTGATDADGKVRFIKLHPGAYEIEVGGEGFNTQIYPGIQVNTLANVSMVLSLAKSDIREDVVVTADAPLLDQRKVGTSTVLDQHEIEQIPTSRDPWAVLSTIPGVNTDRVNVGGNESGQQSVYVGKGDAGASSTWVMDGVEFTDVTSQGASATYLDFNSFEQIGFVSGGSDIEQYTGGLRLNFVTKQGSNRHTGTIRMLFADVDTQSTNNRSLTNPQHVVDAITMAGGDPTVRGNGINEVFEKNFDIGGPILKDKLWYWAGYTQNDIDIQIITGASDATTLKNLSFKVHGQASGQTTYKAFWTEGDKVKSGRGASTTRPAETTWDQDGPTPIFSGSVSHFFGPDLEVSGQWSKVEGGFQLIPKGGSGPGTQVHQDFGGTWRNSFFEFVIERPSTMYTARANWFKNWGGWENELKFGFRYKEADRKTVSKYGGGDGVLSFADGGAGSPGLVLFYRDGVFNDVTEFTSLWAGNTMLKGNWAINYGLHLISQEGEQLSGTVPANVILAGQPGGNPLPAVQFGGLNPGVEWEDLLPRIGATYTFDTAKRLLVRGSYAQYVDQLGNGDIGFGSPTGPSYLGYYWYDNGDQFVQLGEVVGLGGGPLFSGNIDPMNPSAATLTDLIDSNLDAPKTDEIILGAEYEVLRDFSVGFNFTWRERDRELWTPLYDAAAFGANGALVPIFGSQYYTCTPSNLPYADGSGRVAAEPLCGLNGTINALDPNGLRGTVRTNFPGYTQEYQGIELTATKRLSNRWSLRAFFAYNDWSQDFSGEALSSDLFDREFGAKFFSPGIDGTPTNLDGGKAEDGALVAIQSGGSGSKNDIWLGTSQWQYNVNGTYQLPKGFSVAANIQGREGYAIPQFFTTTINDADGGVQTNRDVAVGRLEDERYDDLFLVDLKLAKTFQLEGNTNVELSLEAFNLFNNNTILQLGREVDNATSLNRINESLSPRIWRFGATIQF